MEEDIELPKRDEEIYKEIGDFELYELTNCIAYEMAIRNDSVLNYIQKLNNSSDPSEFHQIKKELVEFGFDYFSYYDGDKFDKNTYNLTYKYFDKNNKEKENNIKSSKDINKIFNIWDFKNDVKSISRLFKVNMLFAREKMNIKYQNEMLISVNLNLPKDELTAYISKIKVEYDKDNSIIKSPLELLGETHNIESIDFKNMSAKEWADNFFIYDYFKKSTDKVKATKLQKIQELLTEYNGVKVEKTKEELQKSKNKNDNSKYKIISFEAYTQLKDKIEQYKKTKPFYSIATINDRLKLMTLLIDDLKYKTLIS